MGINNTFIDHDQGDNNVIREKLDHEKNNRI